MRSNAAARSLSSAHRRLQVFPRAVTKPACIASWQERPGRNPYDRDSNRASHSGSSAPAVRACSALSAITGMPSPRRFPPAFGMKIRLTGLGFHEAAPSWSQKTSSARYRRPADPARPGLLLPDVPRLLVLRVALRLPGLLDRELGGRVGLEPLVRDRHAAADGPPVAAVVEALQRGVDPREPVAHAVGDRVVHALGGQR